MMPPSPVFKRGDVVLVLYPNSNLTTAKTRPALVIQADDIQTGLSQIVVAMISSQMSRGGHPSRVSVARGSHEWLKSGLLLDSVVMTDNIATVMHAAVHRVIGELPMIEVDKSLRFTLGL